MMNNLVIDHFNFRSFVFITDLRLALVDISNSFIGQYLVFMALDQPLVEDLILEEDLTLEEVSSHLIFISIVFNSIALKNIIICVNFLVI